MAPRRFFLGESIKFPVIIWSAVTMRPAASVCYNKDK